MKQFILSLVIAVLGQNVGSAATFNRDDKLVEPGIPQEFIRAAGTKFTDGSGNEFVIKGMGLYNGNPDSAPQASAGFNEDTYKKLSSIGFNAVRFYFGANTFEKVSDGTISFKEDAFAWLDRHIAWAEKYKMKIILNMHHSPGEKTIGARSLFTHPDRQDRFVALWKAIATRYAHEPTLLGYDLVNEPHCKILANDTPDKKFAGAFKLYESLIQRTINAIREVDKNHVVIVEHLWLTGVDEAALGVPKSYYNPKPNDQRDTWRNVNGKYNFPDVVDFNYAYTYHVYEPGRYVHQFTSGPGFDDDGSGGPNRVYPSSTVAKWNEKDPQTGKPWTMHKDFLEYAYTLPLNYVRNVKGVPCFVGELGLHVSNFERNNAGVNKGGEQWVLDVMDILKKHGLSFSYHSYRTAEFHPRFNKNLETAFRKAFGTE